MAEPKPHYSWVFFDLGATLVDVRDFATWIQLGRQLGLDLSEDHLTHAWQEVDREADVPDPPPFEEAWRRVLERASGRPVVLGVAEEFLHLWRRAPLHVQLYSDTRRCLDQLKGDGRHLGILSNSSSEARVRSILDAAGIASYFELIITPESAGAAKPSQAIFRAAAERAGVHPREAFYVGDQPFTDAKSAAAAGFGSVWLNREGWGFGDDPPELTSLTELPFHLYQLEGSSPVAPVK